MLPQENLIFQLALYSLFQSSSDQLPLIRVSFSLWLQPAGVPRFPDRSVRKYIKVQIQIHLKRAREKEIAPTRSVSGSVWARIPLERWSVGAWKRAIHISMKSEFDGEPAPQLRLYLYRLKMYLYLYLEDGSLWREKTRPN